MDGIKDRSRWRYIDIPNKLLYPFGYGLSYTDFELSSANLSEDVVTENKPINAKVRIKSVGIVMGRRPCRCISGMWQPVWFAR